jgi:hypothetical protein
VLTLGIARNEISYDTGFQRPMIVINGQFPGPLIECNSGEPCAFFMAVDNSPLTRAGDILRVTVNNLMANSRYVRRHPIIPSTINTVP